MDLHTGTLHSRIFSGGCADPLHFSGNVQVHVKGTFKNDVSFCLLNKRTPPTPLSQQVSAFGLPPYPPESAFGSFGYYIQNQFFRLMSAFGLTPYPPGSASVSFWLTLSPRQGADVIFERPLIDVLG